MIHGLITSGDTVDGGVMIRARRRCHSGLNIDGIHDIIDS
jgi:hypothetical protein